MALDQLQNDELEKLAEKARNPAKKEKEMSFFDHLEDLRWHLIRGIAALLICAVAVFFLRDWVFEHIIFAVQKESFPTFRFFCSLGERFCLTPPEFSIQAMKIEEKFVTILKVSFFLGLSIAFPYIIWEIWRFVKPALYNNEKKAARGLVTTCSLLFFVGISFGYFVIMPFAFKFLSEIQVGDTIVQPTLSSYINNIVMYTIPSGLIFELPVFVYMFARIGLLNADVLKKYRRMAIVVILVVASIITPPDVTTQILISVPLYILYEASIVIARRTYAKYQAKED